MTEIERVIEATRAWKSHRDMLSKFEGVEIGDPFGAVMTQHRLETELEEALAALDAAPSAEPRAEDVERWAIHLAEVALRNFPHGTVTRERLAEFVQAIAPALTKARADAAPVQPMGWGEGYRAGLEAAADWIARDVGNTPDQRHYGSSRIRALPLPEPPQKG